MTIKKIKNDYWHSVFGNEVLENGVHEWNVKIDKYDRGDKSGIIYGVCKVESK